jgi:hypothetical protein
MTMSVAAIAGLLVAGWVAGEVGTSAADSVWPRQEPADASGVNTLHVALECQSSIQHDAK